MNTHISSSKLKVIRRRLARVYGIEEADILLDRLYRMVGRYGVGAQLNQNSPNLTARDVVLITYADMVKVLPRSKVHSVPSRNFVPPD